ncbi:RDD family protein [Aquihabitans daechungensis]|uniref:RDD family protein n=1 Tax=Aquihabitans daechungensis TaxID=1052257 RepID=UPI003BA34EC6
MTAPSALPLDPTRVEIRRICAWSLDLLMFLVLVFGVLFATGGIDITSKQFATTQEAVTYCNSIDTDDGRRACSPYQDEAVVVHAKGDADPVWLINTVFYILLQGLTGGSVGKLLLGLRVVDAQGQLAGISKSFLRTLLWVVDAITCGLPVVGGTLMVTKAGHQRFGDRVAGTYVVRKESVGVPVVIPPPQAPAPYVFHLPPPGYAPPPGYGPPPGAPPYPPPAASPPFAERAPSRPSVEAPDTDGPHWDDDRDTYIQFDRAVDMWVQWDETARHWRPIET